MNLQAITKLNKFKEKTEKKVSLCEGLVASISANISEIIDDMITYAKLEIETAKENGIDDCCMSDFAQALKLHPELEYAGNASIFKFIADSNKDYEIPMIERVTILEVSSNDDDVEEEIELKNISSQLVDSEQKIQSTTETEKYETANQSNNETNKKKRNPSRKFRLVQSLKVPSDNPECEIKITVAKLKEDRVM